MNKQIPKWTLWIYFSYKSKKEKRICSGRHIESFVVLPSLYQENSITQMDLLYKLLLGRITELRDRNEQDGIFDIKDWLWIIKLNSKTIRKKIKIDLEKCYLQYFFKKDE